MAGSRLERSIPSIIQITGLTLAPLLVLAPFVLPLVTDLEVLEVVAACAGGYPLVTAMLFLKRVREATNGHNGA